MPVTLRSVITDVVKRDPDRSLDDIRVDVLDDLRGRPLDEILEMVTPLVDDNIVVEVRRAKSLERSKEREERRQQKGVGQPGGQVSPLTPKRQDVWTTLRNVPFSVGGVSYTWGNAPREVHLAAAKQHEHDARQHRRVVEVLNAAGKATLDELLDAAAA